MKSPTFIGWAFFMSFFKKLLLGLFEIISFCYLTSFY